MGRVDLNKTAVELEDLHQVGNPPQMAALQEAIGTRIRPVHDDIILAKLKPGQVSELEVYGRRGYIRDHAKYCPVSNGELSVNAESLVGKSGIWKEGGRIGRVI